MGKTLFERIWERHLVAEPEGEPAMLFVDLHLIHEVTSPQAFDGLRLAGRTVRRPGSVDRDDGPQRPDRRRARSPIRSPRRSSMPCAANCEEFGVRLFATGSGREGIVHVIGPELGLTQPGMTIVCGDSHTATHGAFGALAFGVGTSEVEHVLATQCLPQTRPRSMRVRFEGELPANVTAKDMILGAIGRLGVAGGIGHVLEYTGEAIRGLSMENRMTICNMSIEAGARAGMIAPDDKTFAYLEGRPAAPTGAAWEQALDDWRTLVSDPDATYDSEFTIDVAELAPQVTWGTNPEMVVPVTGRVPDPAGFADPDRRAAAERALTYMGLEPGTAMQDISVDRVFIGSCTNARIEDLRAAAAVVAGKQVHPGVRALGRAGVGDGQADRRGGRARPDLPRRRLRVAPRGVLDVPRHEPRRARGRRALRLDLQPQLRGPAGTRRPHAPGQPAARGGDGDRRPLRRPARAGDHGMKAFHSVSGPSPCSTARTSTPIRSSRSSS